MSKFTSVVLLIITFILTASFTNSHQPTTSVKYKSKFRYLIISNYLNDESQVYQYRSLSVLMNEEELNADNLGTLYYLISKRFPSPSNINITVGTSLNQFMTPEEADYFGGKGGESPVTIFSHASAYLRCGLQGASVTIRKGPEGEIMGEHYFKPLQR